MIKIVPVYDPQLINEVVNHPDIRPGAIDGDGEFSYSRADGDHWVAVLLSGVLCGLGRATEVKRGTYECHAMLYREFRGETAVESGRAFFNWIFNTLPANCVISYASDKYRYGGIYCRAIGLRRVGIIHDFFIHGGECYDATMYSATREDLGYGRRR